MNTGIAFIGIVCVAICAIPFLLTYSSRKRKQNLEKKEFDTFLMKHQAQLDYSESCGNYHIGIDQNKMKLYFQLHTKHLIEQEVVNLDEMSHAESKRHNSKKGTIDKLVMILYPMDKNLPSTFLDFYDINLSYLPSGEIESIEKWQDVINKTIKHN